MKKYIFILMSIFVITSCSYFSNDSKVFDSDKLNGKYKLCIAEILKETLKDDPKDNIGESVAKGAFGLAAGTIKCELNFYGNGKGLYMIDYGILSGFMNNNDTHFEFKYKVVNDSILNLSELGSEKENAIYIIKKFSDTYDVIELQSKEDKQAWTLVKILE